MSEFSRETLLNIIETDHVQCGEASALAHMALAALDSEPVARDEREAFEAFMAKRFGDLVDQRRAKNGDHGYMAWDMVVVWIVWQARAAMLAAAQQSAGSEPATVPGKWIPVSERMPDVGDIVLTAMGGSVNVGEMERSGANYRYFTSVISGRELPVTHWMPLPAAPQEVK